VLTAVRKVEGVFDVHRITGTKPVERTQLPV
jgi:GTP pyrophosphokinase